MGCRIILLPKKPFYVPDDKINPTAKHLGENKVVTTMQRWFYLPPKKSTLKFMTLVKNPNNPNIIFGELTFIPVFNKF